MAVNILLNLQDHTPMMNTPWRIELLGWLRAAREERVVTRFRTHKTGALLAYLAYYQNRSHPREVLIELLWPESPPAAGRQSLRKALSSLRHQLEPPGVPADAVLRADHATVQLNPAAVITDVAEFETALRTATQAASGTERVRWLTAAANLYGGELLPGYYADWIMPERQRLAEAHLQALEQLVALTKEAGDLHGALQWARRAVAADALREEAHAELIRLLAAAGQPEAAQRQYRELERLLAEALGTAPSPEVRQLAQQWEREGGRAPKPRRPEEEMGRGGRAMRGPERPGPAPGDSGPSGEPGVAPELQTVAMPAPPAGHLPLQFTRFFGREEEMARLQTLLLDPQIRLVTLTGPGGSGKTRLALETARRLLASFHQAVWFVPLLDLLDPKLIMDRVLDALGRPHSPEREPLERVAAFLCRQPSLLLLDNFEHLIEGGAALLQRLRERVQTLSILVSSRQRLGLPGEQEFAVAPLPVPVESLELRVESPAKTGRSDLPSLHSQLSTLTQCASVQLFVDRAQAVRADFQLTRANAGAVAGVCRRLEGLPLAIELAAARTNVLTPPQMLERLAHRFDLLVSRRRETDPRHLSLRATLDWSYQLLSPELQRFFAQLSIFRGGWTLAAAEAVCQRSQALDLLTELRECSLVQTEESGGEMRYRLLETVREYAGEKLCEAAEAEPVRRRHLEFFLRLAEEAEPELEAADQVAWLERLEAEHDNLRAALAWGFGAEPALALRLAGALGLFWELRGYWFEGREALERGLALAGDAPLAARAKASRNASSLAGLCMGDIERWKELVQESLRLSRKLGDRREIGRSLFALGASPAASGSPEEARALLEESLGIARETGDQWIEAWALWYLGRAALARGEYETARPRHGNKPPGCSEPRRPSAHPPATPAPRSRSSRATSTPGTISNALPSAGRWERPGSRPPGPLARRSPLSKPSPKLCRRSARRRPDPFRSVGPREPPESAARQGRPPVCCR